MCWNPCQDFRKTKIETNSPKKSKATTAVHPKNQIPKIREKDNIFPSLF